MPDTELALQSRQPDVPSESLDSAESKIAPESVPREDGWYYVLPDGTERSVLTWDNGPDPFAEGLARSRQGDGIAYFDETLAIIIPATYDFGWPFEDGVALVCRGCRPEPDGEHTAMVGGSWGYIDRDGREVVPVELSRDEAFERRPGG